MTPDSGSHMNPVDQVGNDMATFKATKWNLHMSLDMLYVCIHVWVLGNYSSSFPNPFRPEDNHCHFTGDNNTFPWIEALCFDSVFTVSQLSHFLLFLLFLLSQSTLNFTAKAKDLLAVTFMMIPRRLVHNSIPNVDKDIVLLSNCQPISSTFTKQFHGKG